MRYRLLGITPLRGGRMLPNFYVIKARFECRCLESGKRIREGEDCLYIPEGKRVYSLDSKTGQAFLSWKYDLSIA